MTLTTEDLTLPALRARYAGGGTPTALCRELLPALAASRAVFISRPSDEEVLERCRWAGASRRRPPVAGRVGGAAGGAAPVHGTAGPGEGRLNMACAAAAAAARSRPAAMPAPFAPKQPHSARPLRRPTPRAAGRWRRSRLTSAARCGACRLL